jgi:acyl-CoA synthetase (NDP forming)
VSAPEAFALFSYPESAARALARAAERSAWLRRPAGVERRPAGIDVEAARASIGPVDSSRWLDSDTTRRVLAAYGMPVARQLTAATAEEAVVAAAELGFPVAVKTAVAGAHKTETGGVALDLTTDDDVRAAATRVGAPVVVQEMVSGGSAELLVGALQDPVFGPLVALGPGGVLAELIGDAHVRLAPLTDVDASEMIDAGRVGVLVRGYRGSPAVDHDSLVDLLLRLSALVDDLPEVAELDLNPVIGLADRVVIVDARIRVSPHDAPPPVKSW